MPLVNQMVMDAVSASERWIQFGSIATMNEINQVKPVPTIVEEPTA